LVGQYLADLGRTFFAADLKPPLAFAGVLPSAGVFCRCAKTLPFTAIDSRTSDLGRSDTLVGIRNDPTCDE
jgi:hypothetical protein